MNLMARVKQSTHLICFSSSPGSRIVSLHPIAALHQCSFYSTYTSQKSKRLTNLGIRKSSESSSIFSQGIKEQNESIAASVWRRPKEIPYDSKFANCVKLIGYVSVPVQFEADSDGKHFASTLISVENRGDRKSLSIPVVFVGELAHVAVCHVKKNNCVFISGQLSIIDSRGMIVSDSTGKFHILVEQLNFVEGFGDNLVDEKLRFSVPFGEVENPSKLTEDCNVKKASMENFAGQPLKGESYSESLMLQQGKQKSGRSVGKKKERDQILHLWRDLVKNPLQWWDYRGHKTNGLVKENLPDFKQKATGESLWVKTAPEFVLPGLGKLECDVKDLNLNTGRTNKRKNDDSWRSLAQNPDKWWDNRMNKRNPKAPDFKHKETGEALWLENSPVCIWALSVKDSQNTNENTAQ